MDKHSTHPSDAELLRQDHYTVDELAQLADINPHVIEQAAFAGILPARIVDHHIVSISREAAIGWLNARLKTGDVEG